PDRISVKSDLHGPVEALFPQIKMAYALNNAKQGLLAVQSASFSSFLIYRGRARARILNSAHIGALFLQLVKSRFRSCSPSRRQFEALHCLLTAYITGRAFVESHNDFGTQRGLDLHRNFRRQEFQTAVYVRTKLNAVFGKLSKIGQREYLKAPRICQQRPVPGDETMKTAEVTDSFRPGSEKKVVRIAENYPGVKFIFQPLESDAFYSALCPYRHENRGFDDRAPSCEDAGPRLTVEGLNFPLNGTHFCELRAERGCCPRLSRSRKQ